MLYKYPYKVSSKISTKLIQSYLCPATSNCILLLPALRFDIFVHRLWGYIERQYT